MRKTSELIDIMGVINFSSLDDQSKCYLNEVMDHLTRQEETIKELKGKVESGPTEDAYIAACEALHSWRDKARQYEALLVEQARGAVPAGYAVVPEELSWPMYATLRHMDQRSDPHQVWKVMLVHAAKIPE